MSNNPLIYTPDGEGSLALETDAFVEAAFSRWPGAEVVWTSEDPDDPVDVTLRVQDPGDTHHFQIFHARALDSVWSDGNESQVLRVAQWIRAAVPDKDKRVVLLDPVMWVAAVVQPGMTEDEILAAWTAEPPMPTEGP
ncbi:hypothetical protein ACIRON_28920 [Nocardioides sp. NPDC101246]|uniref:hypothetical protein n=1 Tax=Nocardioides sp. NPDC101246 TaxID=3364336 RepID=UPI0038087D77